jgi:4a-hydroxytetrahydrobiopterin dehydratase
MNELINQTCVMCTGKTPKLTNTEIERLNSQVPGWTVSNSDGVLQLHRAYIFNNFNDSIEFTNAIAVMAEQQNHHPAILTEWGKVTVTWWTHTIKGLHSNDFICALQTDKMFNS